MTHPKYSLDDQVRVRRGQGSTVFRITGIKQDAEEQPFRYESKDGEETNFFSEAEIIAVLRDGNWQATQSEVGEETDEHSSSGNIASLWPPNPNG